MGTTWIVVADRSRARIFAAENTHAEYLEIDDLLHDASRVHEQELTSDLPGRTFDRAGQGRHSMGQKVGVKEQEAIVFATELADYLERGLDKKRFNKLVIAAAPAFLGLLRQRISERVRSLVRHELDKDLTQLPTAQIRDHLPERLPSV